MNIIVIVSPKLFNSTIKLATHYDGVRFSSRLIVLGFDANLFNNTFIGNVLFENNRSI